MKTLLALIVAAIFLWLIYVLLKFSIRIATRIRTKAVAPMAPVPDRPCEITESATELTLAARIAAPLAGFVIWLAAPTGLGAVGVYLGIVRTPVAVTIASALVVLTITAGFLAAVANMYARRQQSNRRAPQRPPTEG